MVKNFWIDCDKLVAWFFLFAEPVDHCAWCFSFWVFLIGLVLLTIVVGAILFRV